MKTLLIRYRTRPDQVAANEALVHAVYDELRARKPEGLRYATFRMDDGVTFVHLATMDRPEAGDALTALPSFKAFQKDLRSRCVEGPEPATLHEVDSYRPAT